MEGLQYLSWVRFRVTIWIQEWRSNSKRSIPTSSGLVETCLWASTAASPGKMLAAESSCGCQKCLRSLIFCRIGGIHWWGQSIQSQEPSTRRSSPPSSKRTGASSPMKQPKTRMGMKHRGWYYVRGRKELELGYGVLASNTQ